MPYNPDKHHRRSIRLKGYDYAQAGAYFVTVCTRDRVYWFGEVIDNQMHLNQAGQIVLTMWEELPERFPEIAIDAHVIMPNHVHGIVWIKPVGAQFIAPYTYRGAMNRAPTTLGEIVRAFKAVTTRIIRQTIFPEFAWQRNYYEHIIRSEESLNRIRQYILDNPQRWAYDRENPAATAPEPENAWAS
ncbi:MAG: transposase [Candidatus Bipolaricaulota bacterium]|nr:transposase [Candidatus Bipolaricaulota bacterium]